MTVVGWLLMRLCLLSSLGLRMHGRRHHITWGGHVPLTLKKKSFGPPHICHQNIPAFFPLLHNQIRFTLSVWGIPIAIEIHSAFSWFPTHHAPDSTPIYSLIEALR